MLDEAFISKLRGRLLRRREALEPGLAEAAGSADPESVKIAEVRDPGDDAVVREHVLLRKAFAGREAEEVRAINRAVERMDLGDYGLCLRCGHEIDATRLEAQPTAARCLACQTLTEASAGSGYAPP